MAITNLDGVIAGAQTPRMFAKAVTATLVAGRPASLWSLGGMPGAGAYNGTLNGVVLDSSAGVPAGAIPHFDPASNNAYLAYLEAQATQPGVLMLMDRLWHNGGFNITINTAQSITSPTWPSRCPTSGIDQAPSTNGLGVLLALEVSAATGGGVMFDRSVVTVANILSGESMQTTYTLTVNSGG